MAAGEEPAAGPAAAAGGAAGSAAAGGDDEPGRRHPGEMMVDEASFAEVWPGMDGPDDVDDEEHRQAFPERFIWDCCGRPGDAEGCEEETVGQAALRVYSRMAAAVMATGGAGLGLCLEQPVELSSASESSGSEGEPCETLPGMMAGDLHLRHDIDHIDLTVDTPPSSSASEEESESTGHGSGDGEGQSDGSGRAEGGGGSGGGCDSPGEPPPPPSNLAGRTPPPRGKVAVRLRIESTSDAHVTVEYPPSSLCGPSSLDFWYGVCAALSWLDLSLKKIFNKWPRHLELTVGSRGVAAVSRGGRRLSVCVSPEELVLEKSRGELGHHAFRPG